MKIKKSLVALTTATAVAISGSAVAVAQTEEPGTGTDPVVTEPINEDEDTDAPAEDAEGSLGGGSSNEDGISGSINDAFGWNDEDVKDEDGKVTEKKTTIVDKFKDIAALFAVIVGLVGGIGTLLTNIEKLTK